jgi:hypothetical protein
MAVWISVGDGFIEADVIRWKEPVFKNRRRGQPARVGDRLVSAEVLREADKDGWVYLLVRHSEVLSVRTSWLLSDVLLPATGEETRRRLGTILRGNPERLAWSDESARVSVVASQFLGNPNPAAPVATDPDEHYSLRSSFNAVSRLNEIRPPKPGWHMPGWADEGRA